MELQGEILFKEKYGSSNKERYFVKPPAQLNIVVVKDDKFSNILNVCTKIFLPQGYPESVSKDYIAYQIWDTAQAFCSTITGILATQEVLRGVGVGDDSATPLAATITWVLKDGCGHLGKILFAYSHGTYLDAYSKKWRLYADSLNDAAMCIEMSLPLFRNYTTFALCVSTVMKAVVGVAGSATRAALTQHHAQRGNMADVSAKDSAQETAVNLIASFTALFIISVFGNSILIFTLMMILHIAFNYFAVRAICLRTLNEPRLLQVIDTYLRKEIIANPCEVNKREPIIFYQLGNNLLDLKITGFQIKIGSSLTQMTQESANASYLKEIKQIYNDKNYFLFPSTSKRIMFIFINENASVDDVLCGYFHAVLLSIIVCAINDHHLPVFYRITDTRPFSQVCKTLQSAEWCKRLGKNKTGFKYEPSYELLCYVHNIVIQEWRTVRAGLLHTGWDLSKHLLMLDEWRLCGEKQVADAIPIDYIERAPSSIDPSSLRAFTNTLNDNDFDDLLEDDITIEPSYSHMELEKSKEKSKSNIKLSEHSLGKKDSKEKSKINIRETDKNNESKDSKE